METRRLSEAIAQPLTAAYKTGGFGLAFLLVGALMMFVVPIITSGAPALVGSIIGLLLVLLPAYFFYVKEIRPIVQAQRRVTQNGELVDAVQDAAVRVTETALIVQSLLLAHAREVVTAVDTVRTTIRAIPGIGRVADSPALASPAELSRQIVETTGEMRQLIKDVRDSLVTADPALLKRYVAKLDAYESAINRLLAGGEAQPRPVAT